MSGIADASSAIDVDTPVTPLSASIAWVGGIPENVAGASGTTAGHFFCGATGGSGGPYTFVLHWSGTHTSLSFQSATNPGSAVTWSGFALNEIETGNAYVTATDTGTGNTYNTSLHDNIAGMAVKRTS